MVHISLTLLLSIQIFKFYKLIRKNMHFTIYRCLFIPVFSTGENWFTETSVKR